MSENFVMRDEFIAAIKKHEPDFSIHLGEHAVLRLADYYELVQQHNPILHLVAPSSAEELATRHILESLTILEYLPENTRFADIGAGAGLPSIPCLLVRKDLRAVLVESKIKKAKFLEEAVRHLALGTRASVVNRQFEEAESGNFTAVTCRALDKFTEKLPRLLKWAMNRKLLLFGGNSLREALEKQKITFDRKLMPLSEQRYLFIADARKDR